MPKRDIKSVNWEDVKAAHDVPPGEGEAPSAPPENKAEAPKAEEPKPEQKKEETKVEEPKPEEKKSDSQTPPVDYEKQLADYKKRAEDAEEKARREKTIREGEREKAKQLAQRLKKNEPGDGEPDGDEKIPMDQIETIAETKAREQIESLKQEQAAEILDEELQALSDNPTERELIKVIYQTELNPNGRNTRAAIRAGLDNAKFLANRERYAFEAEQRAKEKIQKDQAQKAAMSSVGGAGGSQGRPEPAGGTTYSPQEMRLLKMVGKDKADGD